MRCPCANFARLLLHAPELAEFFLMCCDMPTTGMPASIGVMVWPTSAACQDVHLLISNVPAVLWERYMLRGAVTGP